MVIKHLPKKRYSQILPPLSSKSSKHVNKGRKNIKKGCDLVGQVSIREWGGSHPYKTGIRGLGAKYYC